MCSCQSIEASKVKPEYFTVLDSFKSLPNVNKKSPCDLARRFLEPKSITLVLPQLTSKRFKENRSPTALRSSCRADRIVWMFLSAKNRAVSSAYKNILQQCTTLGKSFIIDDMINLISFSACPDYCVCPSVSDNSVECRRANLTSIPSGTLRGFTGLYVVSLVFVFLLPLLEIHLHSHVQNNLCAIATAHENNDNEDVRGWPIPSRWQARKPTTCIILKHKISNPILFFTGISQKITSRT